MPAPSSHPQFRTGAQVGREAAWLEVEHQAAHWDTPDHGDTGHLLAEALRAAALIGRTGGLQCEHRAGSATAVDAVWSSRARTPTGRPLPRATPAGQPPGYAWDMQAENDLVADLQHMARVVQAGLRAHESVRVWQARREQIATLRQRIRTMRAQHLG